MATFERMYIILIEDTDKGRELSENIKDLKNLMFLYDNGIIAQN